MSTFIGPDLPPGFEEQESKKVYGVALPPELSHEPALDLTNDISPETFGIIGPLPPEQALQDSVRHIGSLKKRKQKDADEAGSSAREEWMLVPPKVLKDSGLSARGFKGHRIDKEKSSCNKVWTTVGDVGSSEEEEQELLNEEAQTAGVRKRDAELQEAVDKFNKSKERQNSLFVQHQKQLTKDKKKTEKKLKKVSKKKKKSKSKKKKKHGSSSSSSSSSEPVGRVPFDREKDLKVVGLDPKLKNNLLSSGHGFLTSQFGHGKQQFL